MDEDPADVLWRRLARTKQVWELYRDGDPAAGVDPAALRALFRRLDGAESTGALLGVCVQASSTLPLLATAARRAPDRQPLRAVADAVLAGEAMVGLAATDTTPGSDLAALTTTVDLGPDEVTVTGAKRWTAAATYASHLLVLARHRPGPAFTNFTWVLVPTAAPGVSVQPVASGLFAGSGTGHATFDRVRLPADHLCGSAGRGLVDFRQHIAVERLAGAGWGHALCQRVLRETVAYLRGRGEGPANLWAQDEVRRRVARCLLATTRLGTLLDRYEHDVADRHDATAAALLKATAAETVEEVVGTCAHLQGARAFADGGLQSLRAATGLWGIGGGTYELMLSAVADAADRLLGPADPAPRGLLP